MIANYLKILLIFIPNLITLSKGSSLYFFSCLKYFETYFTVYYMATLVNTIYTNNENTVIGESLFYKYLLGQDS